MGWDWKETLSKVAPMIGTAIGGPFGGMAASAALNVLGVTPEKGREEDQLQEALVGMTPDQAIQLKTANQNWLKTMKELGLKEKELHARDRDSARGLAKETGIWPQIILSVIYTIAYGVVLYCFMTGKLSVPEDQKILFGSLIGILTGAQVQILNFWFGSSSGSKEKTNKLSG
jgi:hypothetical protein